MIPDSEQRAHLSDAASVPGILRPADAELASILVQVGTPELFRQGAGISLSALGLAPLLVQSGRLSLVRTLVNGPPLSLATLIPGDVFSPAALHPIVRTNSVLLAEEDSLAYTIVPGYLTALRDCRPDLATALDRQINALLRRLLDETEALLQSLGGGPATNMP
jgi:CRP-like cAMP-binding protein